MPAFFAFDDRIGEAGTRVPRGFPYLFVHQDGRIDAVHVAAGFDEHAPPEVLDILLQRETQRAVVPRSCEAAVYLGALIDEAAPLRKRHYLFHTTFLLRHCS